MLIDIRYHISSLAAIFLALGIGIVIGGVLIGEGTVVKEQERIISGLEQEFENLRVERRILQNSLKRREVEAQVYRQFQAAVFPFLTKGVLKDRRIAVFRTNETLDDSHEKAICAALKEAGAEVVTSIAFTSWSGLKYDYNKLQEFLSSNFNPDKSWSTNLLTGLMEGLAMGKAGGILSHLHELKFLQYEGFPEKAIDSIVLIGGSNSQSACRMDLIDLPLSVSARESGLTVIGVEPFNVEYSYISDYKKAGLTTVDNIDTIPGRVALIYALSGRKTGNYGVKETAKALIPDLSLNLREASDSGDERVK